MIGAVLYETGKPLVVENEIQIPALLRGQVLVEIAYSGVCHSQVMEARGRRGVDKFLPHLLGHEATGVVQDIGPDVTKVKKGDRVILGWIKGSGIEAGGCKYSCKEHVVNSGGVTTFSSHAVASENRLTILPQGVPMDIGVLFGCALLTGAGMVFNQVKPKEQSTIAVIGLGGIGLSALIAAKLFKPTQLVGIDVSHEKLELAKSFGATSVINSDKNPNWVAELLKMTEGKGFDYVVEAAGQASTIESGFEATKRGGLCVFASHPENGQKIQIDPYELICGKRIQGSWGGGSQPDQDIEKLAALYREGNLPLEKFFTKKYQLSQINVALEDLEQKRAIRPLVEINPALGI